MKFFIEATQSKKNTLEVIKHCETENHDIAEQIFLQFIKHARNGEGDGVRMLSGKWYDVADIIETWNKW